MAPRPFWTGYLKLSLVTCPVAMSPAHTENKRIRFHTLNRKTGDVPLEEDELDAVTLERTRTIDIESFTPRDSIKSIWYDRPHYLTPNGEIGVAAYTVVREAMSATKTVGLSRLVLYRRERPILLEPRDRGIVVWTLRYGEEVRDPAAYFSHIKAEKVEPELMNLITRLIDERETRWSAALTTDPVQKNLKQIIAAKKKGARIEKTSKPHAPASSTNVISIMDALKRSIETGKRRSK